MFLFGIGLLNKKNAKKKTLSSMADIDLSPGSLGQTTDQFQVLVL
jgi:hypothetical protein